MKNLTSTSTVALIIGVFSFLLGCTFLLQGHPLEDSLYTIWVGFILAGSAALMNKKEKVNTSNHKSLTN